MQKKIETAYLHIGLPKTGTTSLQAALARSRGKLCKNGILYPGRSLTDHNFLAYELHKRSDRPSVRNSRYFAQALERRREMGREIEAFSGDVMIVSAEIMSNLDRENCRKIVEYFSQYCKKITICAYIKNPLDLTGSMIQQKVNNLPLTIEYMERLGAIKKWLLNKERLSGWIGETGLENILPVPYDRQRLIGGSTVTDFLARTGIDGALVETPPEESNSGLTMTGMFVKNEMNKRAGSKGLRLRKIPYLLSLPGPRFLPSKRFAEAMRERCREDLAWLSATFAIDLAPIDIAPIGLANDSGGHRGPWQDYFTDEVKTVLKDMLDRRRKFRSAIEEQIFREVGEDILSGRIFAS